MDMLRQQLRSFIVEHFLFGEDTGMTDDSSMLDEGVLDSTGVMELVSHLESTYGFDVAGTEVIPENLDSIDNLVKFVERKQSSGPGPVSAT